jgi:hypothetical protein
VMPSLQAISVLSDLPLPETPQSTRGEFTGNRTAGKPRAIKYHFRVRKEFLRMLLTWEHLVRLVKFLGSRAGIRCKSEVRV